MLFNLVKMSKYANQNKPLASKFMKSQ